MIRQAIGQWVRRTAESEGSQRLAIPAGLAVATLGSAMPWLHAFRVPGQVALLAMASFAPVAVTTLAAGAYRRPAAVSYALSAGLLALLLLFVSGFHVGLLLADLSKVPDRLLAETLPLTGTPVILSPVLVITWLCGALSTELHFRSRPTGAVGDFCLAVPAAFFVLAYAVSAGAPGRDWLGGAIVFVGVSAAAALRQQQRSVWTIAQPSDAAGASSHSTVDPRAIPVARRAVAIRSVGGAVVVAAVLSAVLPSVSGLAGKPATLNRPAPVLSKVIIDPVGATASLRDANPAAPARRLMAIATDRPSPGYFASAILDGFDGSQWTFEATFKPTGGRVPLRPGAVPLVGAEDLQSTETVESNLPSGLLPVADRAVSVSGAPVAADDRTGMVILVSSTRGNTFTVSSKVATVSITSVPGVDGIAPPGPPGSAVGPGDVSIPPDSNTAMATAARFVTRLVGSRPSPTVGFLQRLVAALRSEERHLSPYAPSPGSAPGQAGAPSGGPGVTSPTTVGGGGGRLGGTSLSEVINAVTVDRSATPEQFATFFALVARYLGVPARLVTGFRLVGGSSGAALPAGAHPVDNRQAWTWVEIPVSGFGWVVADPTPDSLTGVAAPPPEQAGAVPTTLPVNKANAVPKNSGAGGHAIAKPSRIPRPTRGGLPGWVVVVLALAALALLTFAWPAASAMRRRLRSRARWSDEPAKLASGAWLELLDGLDRAGMPIDPSSTGSEIAADASGHFGAAVGPRVRGVAEIAESGLYSISHPPDMEDALRAWDDQRELTRDVIHALDRRQRARALLAVGSGPGRSDR